MVFSRALMKKGLRPEDGVDHHLCVVFSRALMKKGLRPSPASRVYQLQGFFARPDEEGIKTRRSHPSFRFILETAFGKVVML